MEQNMESGVDTGVIYEVIQSQEFSMRVGYDVKTILCTSV